MIYLLEADTSSFLPEADTSICNNRGLSRQEQILLLRLHGALRDYLCVDAFERNFADREVGHG